MPWAAVADVNSDCFMINPEQTFGRYRRKQHAIHTKMETIHKHLTNIDGRSIVFIGNWKYKYITPGAIKRKN